MDRRRHVQKSAAGFVIGLALATLLAIAQTGAGRQGLDVEDSGTAAGSRGACAAARAPVIGSFCPMSKLAG